MITNLLTSSLLKDVVPPIGYSRTPIISTKPPLPSSPCSMTKPSFGTTSSCRSGKRLSPRYKPDIKLDFYPGFTSRKTKSKLNLTKFDFKQSQVEISLQADSTSSSTPTSESLPISGATVFGELNSSSPEPSSLIPHPTSPSPSPSQTPKEETPSTWNDSNVSYWNPTFSCSIHLIMTAWTVLHPPLWLVPLEPVPQAYRSWYIGVPESSPFRKTTRIFVSAGSTSVIAISAIPEHHPPHQELTFGTHAFSEADP